MLSSLKKRILFGVNGEVFAKSGLAPHTLGSWEQLDAWAAGASGPRGRCDWSRSCRAGGHGVQVALELCDRSPANVTVRNPGGRGHRRGGQVARSRGATGEGPPAGAASRALRGSGGWPGSGCSKEHRGLGAQGSGCSLPPGVSFLRSKFAACGITCRPRMLLTGPPRATAGPTPPRPSETQTAEGGHSQTGTFTLRAGPVPKTISQGAVPDVRERVPPRGGAAPGQRPQQKRRQRPDGSAQGEIRERHLAPGDQAPQLCVLQGGTPVGTEASRAASQGPRPSLCACLPQGRLAKV